MVYQMPFHLGKHRQCTQSENISIYEMVVIPLYAFAIKFRPIEICTSSTSRLRLLGRILIRWPSNSIKPNSHPNLIDKCLRNIVLYFCNPLFRMTSSVCNPLLWLKCMNQLSLLMAGTWLVDSRATLGNP